MGEGGKAHLGHFLGHASLHDLLGQVQRHLLDAASLVGLIQFPVLVRGGAVDCSRNQAQDLADPQKRSRGRRSRVLTFGSSLGGAARVLGRLHRSTATRPLAEGYSVPLVSCAGVSHFRVPRVRIGSVTEGTEALREA